MESIMLLQILRVAFTFCLYFLTLACYLTPVFLTKCWNSKTQSNTSPIRLLRNRQLGFRYISWCNCTATGIFLAMCFLGLLPYVQEKFIVVFKKIDYKAKFPVAECVIVLGFFITLLLEQILVTWQERRDVSFREDTEQGQGLLEECEMQDLSDDPSGIVLGENNGALVSELHLENHDNSTTKFCGENSAKDNHINNVNHGYHHFSLLVRRESGFLFYVLAFASGMHSVFEGIALGLQADIPKAVHLFIAVIIHECLVSIALGVNSSRLRYSFGSYVKIAIVYSSAIPLGILIGVTIEKTPGISGELASAILQGLSSGVFLHVIFQDFLPTQFSNKEDRVLKVFFVFMGFAIIAIITYFVNEF